MEVHSLGAKADFSAERVFEKLSSIDHHVTLLQCTEIFTNYLLKLKEGPFSSHLV